MIILRNKTFADELTHTSEKDSKSKKLAKGVGIAGGITAAGTLGAIAGGKIAERGIKDKEIFNRWKKNTGGKKMVKAVEDYVKGRRKLVDDFKAETREKIANVRNSYKKDPSKEKDLESFLKYRLKVRKKTLRNFRETYKKSKAEIPIVKAGVKRVNTGKVIGGLGAAGLAAAGIYGFSKYKKYKDKDKEEK